MLKILMIVTAAHAASLAPTAKDKRSEYEPCYKHRSYSEWRNCNSLVAQIQKNRQRRHPDWHLDEQLNRELNRLKKY
jgi:hypothetical protein